MLPFSVQNASHMTVHIICANPSYELNMNVFLQMILLGMFALQVKYNVKSLYNICYYADYFSLTSQTHL